MGGLFNYRNMQNCTVRCHFHERTELIYVTSGTLRLNLNGNVKSIRKGEFCYISGGALHGLEGAECAFELLSFDALSLLGQSPSLKEYIAIAESSLLRTSFCFKGTLAKRIFSAAKEQNELLVTAALCEFYDGISPLCENESGPHGDTALLQAKAAISYVEENFKEDISLEQIARRAELSPKYFCRYFKALTDRTPIDYLNLCRTEYACKLLLEGRTVADTAYECGFSDVSYFVRAFKKYNGGITPKQYALKKEALLADIA